MSLPTERCKAPREQYDDFLCAVCYDLPPYLGAAFVVACSHVACMQCQLDWMDRSPSRPTCLK